MPYYDYRCPTCGPFDLRRALSESALPANCPRCSASSPRMVSAPHIASGHASSSTSSTAPGGCGSGHCGHSH